MALLWLLANPDRIIPKMSAGEEAADQKRVEIARKGARTPSAGGGSRRWAITRKHHFEKANIPSVAFSRSSV